MAKVICEYFDSNLTTDTLIQVLRGDETTDWTLIWTCISLSLTVEETGTEEKANPAIVPTKKTFSQTLDLLAARLSVCSLAMPKKYHKLLMSRNGRENKFEEVQSHHLKYCCGQPRSN